MGGYLFAEGPMEDLPKKEGEMTIPTCNHHQYQTGCLACIGHDADVRKMTKLDKRAIRVEYSDGSFGVAVFHGDYGWRFCDPPETAQGL